MVFDTLVVWIQALDWEQTTIELWRCGRCILSLSWQRRADITRLNLGFLMYEQALGLAPNDWAGRKYENLVRWVASQNNWYIFGFVSPS